MGLLSKFKKSSEDAARPGASSATDATDVVRDARVRARRRLIGAALLLGIGIIGFPLLFETQPRPIAVDIPVEIPSRDSVAPLQPPPARPAKPVATAPLPAASPAEDMPPAGTPAASERVASAAASAAATKPPETRPAPPKPTETKPAAETKPAPKPADSGKGNEAANDEGRFVVQIGAFAEVTSAREARMKVEAMGLKTYTQVIESSSGRRIRVRVGPYATKAEAEKAAAKIKSGGLQAAVLVL